jgi:hypothetical protein
MRQAAIVGGLAIGAMLISASASAQASRTFVAATGVDTNPCSLGAPCRTLQRAHDQTNPGGEIMVLSPAGYGALTINKAISIVNDGVGEAAVSTNNTTGIMIQAGPNDVINLRGLTVVGSGVADYGIRFAAGGALNVQNTVIRGFSGGLFFYPGNSSKLNVSDSVLSNNGNDGIYIQPIGSSLTVVASFERVQSIGNFGTGFEASGDNAPNSTITVSAADCAAVSNSIGFLAAANAGTGAVNFAVVNSRAVGNTRGVESAGPIATLSVASSTLSGNTDGYYQSSGGAVASFGNNFMLDTTNVGTLSSVSPH